MDVDDNFEGVQELILHFQAVIKLEGLLKLYQSGLSINQ